MVDFKIDPKRTALLVFDMINDFVKKGAPFATPEALEIIPRLKKLIEHCRSKKIPVIYACQVHRPDCSDMGLLADIWPPIKEKKGLIQGTEGVEVYNEIKPKGGDIIVWKHRYSAFYNTDLEIILRNKGVDTLIITGGTMNIGCETTARDALNRDIRVVFPSDGNIYHDIPDMGWGVVKREEIAKVVLSTINMAIGKVTTISQLIAEI